MNSKMKTVAGGALAVLLCAALLIGPAIGGFADGAVSRPMAVEAKSAAAPAVMADTADLVEITGTSRMEMDTGKMGLAFRFNLDCEGVTLNDRHVGDYTNGKVNALADGKDYTLVSAGAVMTNNAAVGTDIEAFVRGAAGPNGSAVIDVNAYYLYNTYHKEYLGIESTGITYAVRITNIPETHVNTDIYVRSYYVFNDGTQDVTVYDDVYYANCGGDSTTPITTTKFATKFTNPNFMYRVGNEGAVKLGTMFEAADATANIGDDVSVTVETVDGTAATGAYTAATDWTQGAVDFDGTGVVKLTITDNDYCTPTELYLEVVDAVNATTATSATANNVVLLQDAGFGSLEVSGGYALYGNGFTLTCGSDSAALDFGYSFVTLNNGTLDNVQIVCPNPDYAALYKSNLDDMPSDRKVTDDKGKTRYYNTRSGVMVSGNSQILNSRISGGRAAVNVTGGNTVIDNSRIERGAVASVLVAGGAELTLRDATLFQEPTASTYDSSRIVIGFSVLSICDSEGNPPVINLEGTLIQDAWALEEYKKYVPDSGQSVVETVLSKSDFVHTIDGQKAVNLGFAYMGEDLAQVSYDKVTIEEETDNRESAQKEAIPYKKVEIKTSVVYSYINENGTDSSYVDIPAYVPNRYSDVITVSYADMVEGLTNGKSFGADGWVYELNVDLDKLPGYQLDFSKVSMNVNGVSVTDYTVNGGAKPAPVAVTAGGTTYTLAATVNGKEYTTYYKVTGTETSKESPSLVAANYEAGLCVASSKGGTWHGAAPALEGIQIKYWSVAESQYKTINLAEAVTFSKGKLNGTNTTWTYTPDNNDFTLTLTGGQVHSSNNVYAMPVGVDTDGDGTADTLYFVAASSNGLVNTGNSARTIPVSYTFKDNNNGDVLTFSHTWSVAEDQDNEYSYSKLCEGTKEQLTSSSGSGSGCVTPDTLITLADGSQKRVDELTGDEMLLVWNMETGAYDAAPIVFVDNDAEMEYAVVRLTFSDGSEVKVIAEHGFFDLDLGKYVYIDADNYADYVGHRFVAEGDVAANAWNVVTLDAAVVEYEVTTAWSPVTFSHLCYYTNGVLSMPGGIEGLFNIFEVNTDTMTYDARQMQEDIDTYGLLTLEDFGGMITEDAFEAFNGKYLAVALGKGLLTWEDIAYMAERYIPLM